MADKRRVDYVKLGALYGADWPNFSGIPRPDPTRGPVFISHEESLRRDLEIINACTVAELGPLLPGGLPAVKKQRIDTKGRPLLTLMKETREEEAMKWNQLAATAAMALGLAACERNQAGLEPIQAGVTMPESKFDPTAHYEPPSIRAVQEYLNAMKIHDERGNALIADGEWRPETSEAVASFQRLHGLPATGISDALTLAAISEGIRATKLTASSRFPTSAASIEAPTESASAKGRWAGRINANLDNSGHLTITAGDYRLILSASECRREHDALKVCARSSLRIARGDDAPDQVLQLEGLYVSSKATLFSGPLDSFEARPSTPTFVLSDVDGDGEDDLILWTGNEGSYGGPSFSVYLFNKKTKLMEYSAEISALTVGATGLFKVKEGKINVSYKEGCCLHVFDSYELVAKEPKLTERVIEDTSGPEPTAITEKLINGELRVVSRERLDFAGEKND